MRCNSKRGKIGKILMWLFSHPPQLQLLLRFLSSPTLKSPILSLFSGEIKPGTLDFGQSSYLKWTYLIKEPVTHFPCLVSRTRAAKLYYPNSYSKTALYTNGEQKVGHLRKTATLLRPTAEMVTPQKD